MEGSPDDHGMPTDLFDIMQVGKAVHVALRRSREEWCGCLPIELDGTAPLAERCRGLTRKGQRELEAPPGASA